MMKYESITKINVILDTKKKKKEVWPVVNKIFFNHKIKLNDT